MLWMIFILCIISILVFWYEAKNAPIVDESRCTNRQFLVNGECVGQCSSNPPCIGE